MSDWLTILIAIIVCLAIAWPVGEWLARRTR